MQSPKCHASNKMSKLLSKTRFKAKNHINNGKPNNFINRKFDPSVIRKKRKKTDLNSTSSVTYLHFKDEVSNYGHLSDSPLPITPWFCLEEFEEVMGIIYDSVEEIPKILPPDCHPEHLHELFFKPNSRNKIVYARSKVCTWKLRSMNIDDAQFLTEFLCCLERLLDYLIAKSFQRQRFGPFLYQMKTLVTTGFITSLETTLAKQSYSYLGRSLKATSYKLFSCPRWVLQIRHKLSHSNTLISNDILEDAISFIFAWFRKNFEFHLTKMPQENYEDNREFYQHRSFSNHNFDYRKFQLILTDLLCYGKLHNENDEVDFLNDLRHFSRFDLNRLLTFVVKIIDTIMFIKRDKADFNFFAPTLIKIVRVIFRDTSSHIVCQKFSNLILDQIIKYEDAMEYHDNLDAKMVFRLRKNQLYRFLCMFVETIIGKNSESTIFFRIYFTDRKSDSICWSKFIARLLNDVKYFQPETFKLIMSLFLLTDDSIFTRKIKTKIGKKLLEMNKEFFANKATKESK